VGPTARNPEQIVAVAAGSSIGTADDSHLDTSPEQHPLARISRVVTSLRNSVDTLQARNQRLEQLSSWFEIALNNIGRGLSMFDGDQCLVLCNTAYAEIYHLPEHLTRPGTPLADI